MNKAIFLDRDGILNHIVMRGTKVSSPWKSSEFKLIDGAKELVSRAKENKFLTIVVTNQPDVSKGFIPKDELDLMHKILIEDLAVDAIEVCESADNSNPRRKPNPGMLLDAIEQFKIDHRSSFFIGDSEKDILAGKNAGVKTVLLETDYNINIHGSADFNCASLSEIREIICPTFTARYLDQFKELLNLFNIQAIEKVVHILRQTREQGGRLFCIGSGGGAGHASHAVCDFRKLCGFEAYAPTDNVSELTARINDDGWSSLFIANYLSGSRLNDKDCLLVFSVGGGSEENNISTNLVNAIKKAKEVGASVVGVVGRDGGYTAQKADGCVVVPTIDSQLITPHTESFQALIWHLIVSHPMLQINRTKWESTVGK